MNDTYLQLRSALWWLLPLAALAVLIAFETDWGRALRLPIPAQDTVAAKPVAVSLIPEYKIDGGIAKHSETISRPLFVPTRRPAPPPVVEVAKPRMQKGQYSLTGTTVAGERSLAFLKETQGGKARTVKQGDSINGLLVAEVKPDRIRLTLGDEYEDLILKVVANSKMTPQPAVAAGAPGAPGAPGTPGANPAAAAMAALAAQPTPPQPAAGAPEQHTETIAERRRAARAAAAAAAAQAETANPSPAAAPAAPAAAPQSSETGWAAIYQRYQQRKN